MERRSNLWHTTSVRLVTGLFALVGLLASAGAADAAAIMLNRTPAPPAAIINDGTGIVDYDWAVEFYTTPDHYVEFVLDPGYAMIQCVFHDLNGWNNPMPAQWQTCVYVDDSASWPQAPPLIGASAWTAPANAETGRYELRVQYYSMEVGDLWEAEAAVVFNVAQAVGDLDVLVWHDANADGVKDPGEEGLPDWFVAFSGPLDNNFGKLTGLDGLIHAPDLPVGEYGQDLLVKPGWLATTPTSLSALVASNATAYVEFGVLSGSAEICNGIDDDYDGEIDEGTEGKFYTITQGETSHTVFAYKGSESALDFYAYSAPKAWTSNTGFEKSDRSTFMLYEEPAGGLSFMLMTDKAQDGSGGVLDLQMVGLNEGATLLQKNDTTEAHYTDTYDMENGFFTWLWYPCCNDGFVISELEIGDDCLTLIPDNVAGISGWDVISDEGVRMTFPSAIESITICPTVCCVPTGDELCDGIDNDCDGEIDEGFGTVTCGVGACEATVEECVDGVSQDCEPGTPSAELCDGLDNDCDGEVDEDFSLGNECSVGGCGSEDYEVWAYADGDVPTVVYNGDSVLFGASLACNFEHPYQGSEEFEQFFQDSLMVLTENSPIVFYAWGAYDGGDYAAMSDTLDDMIVDGAIDDYDLWDVSEFAPLDLEPGDLDGVEVVILDAAPDTSASHFVVTQQAREVLADYVANGGKIAGSAYIFVHWTDYTGYVYEDINMDLVDLFGGVTPILGPHYSKAVTTATSPAGEGQDLITLIGAEPWHVGPADPFYHDFWGLKIPLIETACYAAGSYVCLPDGSGVICDAVPGIPGVELCGNNIDDDCDCEVDEGFEDVGTICSAGVGACYVEGEIICSEDSLATECNAIAAAAGFEGYLDGPYAAGEVVDTEQGLGSWGGPIGTTRSNPETGLTLTEENVEGTFYSLGYGGWIIAGFDCPVHNGPGVDLQVWEKTYGPSEWWPEETADVFAWDDAAKDWVYLGQASNQPFSMQSNVHYEFDLGSLPYTTMVKIVDTTVITPTNNDAYDLNGVYALHPCTDTCDGVDNDCDGEVDEDQGQTSCGVGVCEHMAENCADGAWLACDPFEGASEELCDGLDNDCDGEVDEGFGLISCGEGACYVEMDECVDGETQACEPGTPTAEVCDGMDNDCDGTVDEGFGLISCGAGACYAEVEECVNGALHACVPGTPTAEICDGIDNDCDGTVDEGFGLGEACIVDPCGYGGGVPAVLQPCTQTGIMVCAPDGGVLCETSGCNLATVWQLGVFDFDVNPIQGGGEYPTDDMYYVEFDYDVVGAGDPAPDMPGYLSFVPMSEIDPNRPLIDGTAALNVHFTLDAPLNGAVLHFSRYGSEDNYIYLDLDGDLLAITTVAEGQNEVYEIPVAYLDAGDHVFSFVYAGGGAENGNYIDAIRLVGESCGDLGPDLCGDGVDNNCDCAIDEGFEDLGGLCEEGVGACSSEGELVCSEDLLSLVCLAEKIYPVEETCDGIDNDCDGEVDGDFGTISCGVGACYAEIDECVDGVLQACVPGAPTAEVCDGVDNDCDGVVDEGFGLLTCGVGICQNTVEECVEGQLQECIPGAPQIEVCDGLDNDCDGATDEGLGAVTCGVGACQATVALCVGGFLQQCEPGTPSVELCDGIDNDCDGAIDDGLGVISCGQGACYEEVNACVDGQTQTCVPGAPSAELCDDFVDNDCDGDIDEGCDTDDDCLLPPGCVGISEAFARGWIIVDTPSSNAATVVLHNIGVAEVCLDENLMMFSDPTQTISTPIVKSGGGEIVIPPDGMLTLRYGPWTYANGYYQPYLNSAPWWCFEIGQYATANTVFSFWGEATPPELANFLNNDTNTDGDGKEDHVDWAGSYGTQTIYNIWSYQANHTVFTAGKTAEATGPGEITVVLVSHNIGAIPGAGMLTDTLPAGWGITDFSVEPDHWIENVDGSVTMIWDISLPGYQDVPGMSGTTVFPYEDISYSLHPALSVDGRRVELPRAEISYLDGDEERTSESSLVVAINVDVDGDGSPACEDCDDGADDVYPGAEELCDGVDNDCDGEIDEGCPVCGNGIVEEGEICDDGENNVDAPNHCQTWCALSLMWPESGQAVVAWEDLPSQAGNDWDYNDWVVEVETEYFFTTEGVISMALYTDPWARGAAYHHAQSVFIGMGTYNSAGSYIVKTYDEQWGDLTEEPPVVFGPDEDIIVEMWEDSWDVLPPNHIGGDYGQYSFDANAESGYGIVLGKKSGIVFEFDTPLDMTPQELAQHVPGTHCENMPFEFFLHVHNTGESISTGDVRMLCVPDLWEWPAEKVHIWDAYDGVTMGSQFPIFSPGWHLAAPVGPVWYP